MTSGFTLSPQSPWPGLRPFSEDDRGFFFGRERETAELLALVQRAVVVVVYGQSGLGKTSLLQAGLFPLVRDAGLLPVRLRLDHGEHAPSMSTQVKAALTAALDAAGVTGPRPGAAETLWEYFHRRDVDLWGARNRLIRPVIAFDQFEEVFTLGQRSAAAIARVAELTAELESLLEHRAPDAVRARLDQRPDDALKYDFQREGVKFIISLREDFLAQLDTWRGRMPSLLPHRFRLERMTGAQALDVVQRAGGDLVDAAVAGEIVDFVSRSQRRAQVGALQARNVEPALLSVVCDELNRRRLDRQQPRITADLLSGERQGIIQAFYDRAFEDVEPRARDWIEDELLTASGYRDRAAQEDALRAGVKEADIDRLVDRRVLHREERDGVVWLELTHDLLTDPAFASRTQREQRRVAEDARRRESETAQQLRRTRRLAAGFAVLSLAMVVAVFFAFRMSSRAADAQVSTQKAFERAVGAEKSAGVAAAQAQQSAKEAQAEAERASSSFGTAMGMAEPLSAALRDFVRVDMRLLTPAVLQLIARADDSYRVLEAQDASATVDQHAGFLATASEVLYEVGHLTDSIGRADQALTMLGPQSATDPPGRRAVRAEALYARAAGYTATGRLALARRDYNSAIALATAEARAATWTLDLARILALSELGLGQIERWALNTAVAEAHDQRVLSFLDGRQFPGGEDQVGLWREQALIGLAQSATDSAEEDRRSARAESALQRLLAATPGNLRLLKISAELGFFRAGTASDLGRDWLAGKLAADALAASTQLTLHDRDNLQSKLTWVRAQRVAGVEDHARGRGTSGRTTLESAERGAADLLKAEPDWRQARYVHAAIFWELGQIPSDQSRVITLMQLARDEFAEGVKRAPGDLDFVRGVSLGVGGIAEAHLKGLDYAGVRLLASQAIAALAPAERGASTDPAVLGTKAYYLWLIGEAWSSEKNWKEAVAVFTTRADILMNLAMRSRLAVDETKLAQALVDLGDAWVKAGDATKAGAQFERAADAATRALAVDPTDVSTIDQAVAVKGAQADLQMEKGDPAGALESLQSASNLVWDALKRESWNATMNDDLDTINGQLRTLDDMVHHGSLAADKVAALDTRVHALIDGHDPEKLADWLMPPLMPGPWRNLVGVDLTKARSAAHQAFAEFQADQVFAVRALALDFHAGRGKVHDNLYEAGIEMETGERGLVAFIARDNDGTITGPFVKLDGTLPPVEQMNIETAPLLDSPQHAAAYLRFFVGMLQASDGPWTIVERPEDLLWRPEAPADARSGVAGKLIPVRVAREADGSWSGECTLIYGASLFRAKLTISPKGAVDVAHFIELTNELPVNMERIVSGVKVLRQLSDLTDERLAEARNSVQRAPYDPAPLGDLARLYEGLGRWKDAVETRRKVIDLLRSGKDAVFDRIQDIKWAYRDLSHAQLRARDFAGALATVDATPSLDEKDLELQLNKAYALLLLGRYADAEKIYRAHLGQSIHPDSREGTWQSLALQQLDEFEGAGITNSDVAKIRKILST